MSSIAKPAGRKGYKGLGMEGAIARWYAQVTARNLEDYRAAARGLANRLTEGASVLEVAPGPGYLAIALAQLGSYRVVGLDISDTFVRMATENAQAAGASVTFMQGNASAMPLDPDSFHLVFCRAAFKNFSEPVEAINEMYRVLKPGGKAIIHDLRPDTPAAAIRRHVAGMGLGRIHSLFVNLTFKQVLLKRAYSEAHFRSMVAQTPFRECEIRSESIGLEVVLTK
jgi:ubiquinone/menaquinone biosynthesis C-methylase UbiE